MRRNMMACACLAACIISGNTVAGFVPSVHTAAPASVPAGAVEIRLGVEYARNEWNMFQSTDIDRELYHLPDLTLTMGMSDSVELILNFPWLMLSREGSSFESGAGDLKITGIYNILKETDFLPACALMATTKLPDASNEKGFGTDRTDFWIGGVFSKTFGDLRLLADISLGILEDPTVLLPNQDDAIAYDIGAVYSITEDLSAGCGLNGIVASRLDNDRTFLRVGLSLDTDFGTFDLSAGTGMDAKSGDLHVVAGFSTAFGPWSR